MSDECPVKHYKCANFRPHHVRCFSFSLVRCNTHQEESNCRCDCRRLHVSLNENHYKFQALLDIYYLSLIRNSVHQHRKLRHSLGATAAASRLFRLGSSWPAELMARWFRFSHPSLRIDTLTTTSTSHLPVFEMQRK